jgi:hypothetical protein
MHHSAVASAAGFSSRPRCQLWQTDLASEKNWTNAPSYGTPLGGVVSNSWAFAATGWLNPRLDCRYGGFYASGSFVFAKPLVTIEDRHEGQFVGGQWLSCDENGHFHS